MGPEGRSDDIRASDVERQHALEVLGRHHAAGRLDMAEFEDRAGASTAAKTLGQLRVLFTDLPPPHPDFDASAAPAALSTRPSVAPVHRPEHTSYGHSVSAYAPYGIEPISGRPYSDKQRAVAGVLQIVLGVFGVGRFYAGSNGVGLAQLLLTLLSFGLLSPVTVLWSLIDGILILTSNTTDQHGRPLR